jgi:hypothetical protein
VDQSRKYLGAKYRLSNGIVRNALLTSNALPHSSRARIEKERCHRSKNVVHHVVKCQSISAENAPGIQNMTVPPSAKRKCPPACKHRALKENLIESLSASYILRRRFISSSSSCS